MFSTMSTSKTVLVALLLTWQVTMATAVQSCGGLARALCRNMPGCTWSGGRCNGIFASPTAPAPAPLSTPIEPCSSRNGNACENGDGMCLRIKNTCQAVNAGTGAQNDSCQAMLTTDSDGDFIYVEIPGKGCAAGFTCDVAKSVLANLTEVPLDGTCEAEVCIGKKVPGNCNGNNANTPDCEAKTERVTICHRTCSATNPWVRITIDEDAWDGEGCGHQQHDIRNECASKAPWTEWGVNRKDYLIKRHGTRDDVAARLKTKAAEKAYWKNWERACPFVRNGACCDWNDPENPCCGDPPANPVAVSAPTAVPAPVSAPTTAPIPTPVPAPVPEPEAAPIQALVPASVLATVLAPLDICPIDMGIQSETACPEADIDIISILDIKSPHGRIIPGGFDIISIFYQMEFVGTSDAPQVQFKVDSPFDFDTDMYLQYETSTGPKGGLSFECESRWDEPGCRPESPVIQAGCIKPLSDKHLPYAIVSLFFVSEHPIFGDGASGNVSPYQCCHVPEEDKNKPMIEYTFKILCACPSPRQFFGQEKRQLR